MVTADVKRKEYLDENTQIQLIEQKGKPGLKKNQKKVENMSNYEAIRLGIIAHIANNHNLQQISKFLFDPKNKDINIMKMKWKQLTGIFDKARDKQENSEDFIAEILERDPNSQPSDPMYYSPKII